MTDLLAYWAEMARLARINADQSPEAVRDQVIGALRAKAFLPGAQSA